MKTEKLLLNIFAYIMVSLSILLVSTLSVYAAQSAVNLGTAGDFVILTKSGISTTGTTAITGNIGVSPIDSTAVTGFGLIADASNTFSTSSLVTGKVYAADYTDPTPSVMTTAVSDMETAYTDAAGRTETSIVTELGAGDISGMTINPGLYKWGTGVLVTSDVTLSGSPNDIWIFQIAQDLTMASGAKILLSGGAQAKNIFWQVGGGVGVEIGTTAHVEGNILAQKAIHFRTGATLNGRALAQTAVTLDANAVTLSAGSIPVVVNKEQNKDEAVKTNNQQQSSDTNVNNPINGNSENSNVEQSQTNQGIGQELSKQIEVRKEEIKSGDYNGPLGQLLRVRELSENLRELRVNDVSAKTNLAIITETDSEGKTKLKTMLKNGQEREIKVMPDTASKKALEKLRVKVCSSDNNCTIQLKDVGSGKTEKIQYEVQLERHSRILGIFQKKMQVSADVDAETEVTTIHKPWWAFIATESAE